MGEGSRRGRPPASTLSVAERLVLVLLDVTFGSCALYAPGFTAVFGGVAGRGGDGMPLRSVGPLAGCMIR